MYVIPLLLCLLLQSGYIATAAKQPQCRFIYGNEFDACSEDSAEEADHDVVLKNRVYSFKNTPSPDGVCRDSTICRNVFNVTRIMWQSFEEKTLSKLSTMLEQCCGKCATYYHGDLEDPLSHIDLSVIEKSDIVYPVLGRMSQTELYGFYFIPMFDVPGAYYFVKEKSDEEMMQDMVFSCLNMWTLFVICLLMAVISGFVIWVLETPNNTEEFPRAFHVGLFEGFWWSFISMTTVGYGDRAPRSPAGRIFAVIWIILGITTSSIYIASLASEIMRIRAPVVLELAGRNIAGLKHRLQDATMVAQHGGILHDYDFNDTVHGVYQLMKEVSNKKMDGFLINKSTYFYFTRMLEEGDAKYQDVVEGIKTKHFVRQEMEYKGEKLVSGILVRSRDHYEYFRRYYENNWLQIQACDAFHLNNEDKKVDESASFDHFQALFYPFFYAILVILGAIMVIGIVYEYCRRSVVRRRDSKEEMRLKENL